MCVCSLQTDFDVWLFIKSFKVTFIVSIRCGEHIYIYIYECRVNVLTQAHRTPERACVSLCRVSHSRACFSASICYALHLISSPGLTRRLPIEPPFHLRPAAVVDDFEIIRFQRNGKERERKSARLDVLRKKEKKKKKKAYQTESRVVISEGGLGSGTGWEPAVAFSLGV